MPEVLIVGTGHAGAQAAIALRMQKFAGTIAMLGDESEPPYERPPLSKEYLSGAKPFERLLLRPLTFWSERNIELLLNRRVVKVQPESHDVVLADGSKVSYSKLIWAAGGSPRRLTCAGGELRGVHVVRTRQGVDAILAELPEVRHVIIIGGGYIGLEAAAILANLGRRVTVLEALDRVLARVAGPALSRFYESEHRAHGVDIRLEVTVDCIVEAGGRAAGVRLADGSILPADMVLVGIGITPSVEPLLVAGAAGSNGVEVDALCQTSLADVFAIGDCALHTNGYADGARIRLESVQNANDQASVAAKVIAGNPEPYQAVPWFWSNQYDLRLQTVGLSLGHDDTVLRGDPAERSFSIIYLKQERVIALDCVNATKDYVQGRALVTGRVIAPRELLADPDRPLQSVRAA